MNIGTIIASQSTPNPFEFIFVISEDLAIKSVEYGTFVQVMEDNNVILGVVENLVHSSKYFSSADIVHGSSISLETKKIFPSTTWEYRLAEVKVLGMISRIFKRSTQPVSPGNNVMLADADILTKFLGFSPNGINLGILRQMNINVQPSLDRLVQKHLAVLSISGGGKSYATSVILEEILGRTQKSGRPATILFDVHGEFKDLSTLKDNPDFKNCEIEIIPAEDIQLSVTNLSSSHFAKLIPSITRPQIRELTKAISVKKKNSEIITIPTLIETLSGFEMNQLVQDALIGWLSGLQSTRLFGHHEIPDLELSLKAGKLIIFDFSRMISLWYKQIIVYYVLDRLFNLRRERLIPPVVCFLEEAHQFAPEDKTPASKDIIETIAREGRKFLCSLVLISQRPVNLSTTALSQCNSQLILKIVNPNDLAYISKTSEGITSETLKLISSLGVGEGLLMGNSVNYPIFVQIRKRISNSIYNEVSLEEESKKYEKMYHNNESSVNSKLLNKIK
jgi:uncharacterized protein